MRALWVGVLIAVFWNVTSSAAICGLVQVQAEAEPGSGDSITLYPGEILPVRSKGKTRPSFNLLLGGVKVAVPKVAMKLLPGVSCSPRVAKTSAAVHAYPVPGVANGLSQALAAGVSVRILSEASANGSQWYRIETGGSRLWIVKADLTVEEGSAATAEITPAQDRAWLRNWTLGGELGMLSGLSSDIYDGLLTNVPNSADVGQLQDPIITSVDKGKGMIVRVFAEHSVWKAVGIGLGLGYRSETYAYNYKNNPSLGSVTLAQLSGGNKDIALKRVQFDVVVGLRHSYQAFNFGVGLQQAMLYTLSDDVEINTLVPSGVFFKNTPAKVKGGPSTIETETWLRLDGRWKRLGSFLQIGLGGGLMYGLGYSF